MESLSGLIRNKAECTECGDVVESKHRHDMVWCSCGQMAVDGGLAYLRRVGKFIERSEKSKTKQEKSEN